MTDVQQEDAESQTGDDELLSQVRGGDTAAFGTLWERHVDAARGLARQLVRGEAEAEDAVADTFTRVLDVVRRGGGPRDGFRPYLLTALRHCVYDRARKDRRQVVTDDMERFDSGEPFVDPAVEGLERSLIARAFLSLRPDWQSVLWYTEIEGIKPAEAAGILGRDPNTVAALAYRAREGLRRAYLQMHLAGGAAAESCRPALELLGGYVRGGLAKRDTRTVDRHLDECSQCREVYAELMDVNVGLRGLVLPLFAGPVAAGYLASLPGGAALGGGWWGRLPKRQQQAAAAGGATVAVAAAAALALVSNEEQVPPPEPPQAAAPQQPAPPPAADPPADPPRPLRPTRRPRPPPRRSSSPRPRRPRSRPRRLRRRSPRRRSRRRRSRPRRSGPRPRRRSRLRRRSPSRRTPRNRRRSRTRRRPRRSRSRRSGRSGPSGRAGRTGRTGPRRPGRRDGSSGRPTRSGRTRPSRPGPRTPPRCRRSPAPPALRRSPRCRDRRPAADRATGFRRAPGAPAPRAGAPQPRRGTGSGPRNGSRSGREHAVRDTDSGTRHANRHRLG
ncbi:sigma-70 family RNA polymerase sigma factor [Nocardiopsis sp. CNT-189]|uniref:sigma-70 family RNA polymerase sigma factor n=1 Tax=Nocardiopsis oceanisediminis TaxID=2816862 RepID=UPI003B3B7468